MLGQIEIQQIMNGKPNFRELLYTLLLLPLWFPYVRLKPHCGVKLFGFEAMWFQDPQSDEVVQEAWQGGLYRPGGCQFINCLDSCLNYLNSCQDRLVSWNKMEFGHVQHLFAGLQKQLQSLELQSRGNDNRELIAEVRCAQNNWLDKELVMWNQ